jgi:hypothetical protein
VWLVPNRSGELGYKDITKIGGFVRYFCIATYSHSVFGAGEASEKTKVGASD